MKKKLYEKNKDELLKDMKTTKIQFIFHGIIAIVSLISCMVLFATGYYANGLLAISCSITMLVVAAWDIIYAGNISMMIKLEDMKGV